MSLLPTNEEELENLLSLPTPEVINAMGRLQGDILVLGIGGKMGPSLARMAKRASDAAGVARRIIGVARFTEANTEEQLQQWGIETLRADLLAPGALDGLPDAANLVFMAGMKFGATGQEPLTWAMNTLLPAYVCRRYPASRIVAFSTGNVYGLTPVSGGGCREADPLNPAGEYAMSCLGRERVFQYHAQLHRQPVALIRLNYACDLRYGVVVDLARKVMAGEVIDLAMGYFNTVWQGDANAQSLRAFDFCEAPARPINVTGARILSVREVCVKLGDLLGVAPRFTGEEKPDALLGDASEAHRLLGAPQLAEDHLIEWVAGWLSCGGRTLAKPTKFESRTGDF